MCKNLAKEDGDDGDHRAVQAGFWGTVVMVELADMTFSIDNIAAAAAFSTHFWVILTGVFIGIAAMRFVAQLLVKLIEKFPVLAKVAYVLVGWIGVQLWVEHFANIQFGSLFKFATIMGIIAAGLVYERVPGVAKVTDPVFNLIVRGMAKVTMVVDGILSPFKWVGGKVSSLFHRTPSDKS
jgi:tellurite resistance protein TerC